jgi:hypothetical protein
VQETCTKLVAQQQLCHEQQEELQFLRAKYSQLSSQLEVAAAATATVVATAAGPGAGPGRGEQPLQGSSSAESAVSSRPAGMMHAVVQQLSRQGSQDSNSSGGRQQAHLQPSQQPLDRASPSVVEQGKRSGTGGKLGSWLGLRR